MRISADTGLIQIYPVLTERQLVQDTPRAREVAEFTTSYAYTNKYYCRRHTRTSSPTLSLTTETEDAYVYYSPAVRLFIA